MISTLQKSTQVHTIYTNNMKKLFIGNLDWGTTEEQLKELFSQYGEIEEAVIIKDKFSGRSKGFGFVSFVNDDEGDKAVEAQNEQEFLGRKLTVNEARPPKNDRF